jgi:hypothetical protein
MNRHEIVKITTFKLDHSCGHQGGTGAASANTAYIARKVSNIIADNPTTKVADIMALIKQEDGIDVPYWAAWKGRKLALNQIYGENQPTTPGTETQSGGRPKRLRSRNIRGPGRKCSKCGIVVHHNARTCQRRRQAGLLPEMHHQELPPMELLEDDTMFTVNCCINC